MNRKDKYIVLMQRWFDAETTQQEEDDLKRFVAETDDPDFEEIRGVMGYLSIGREKKKRKRKSIRMYSLAAAAACLVAIASIGLGLGRDGAEGTDDYWVRYTYGETDADQERIMASVASSLADFFAGDSPAETNLIEMFQR